MTTTTPTDFIPTATPHPSDGITSCLNCGEPLDDDPTAAMPGEDCPSCGRAILMRYWVLTAAAKMPASCRGTYRRVAVVESKDGHKPLRITERDLHTARVVKTWEKLNVGTTPRCEYFKTLAGAVKPCRQLNAEAVIHA